MTSESFEQLVAAVRAGDEHAFGMLWRETNPGLVRYLRVIAAGRAGQLAAATWRDVIPVLRRFRGTEAQWQARVFASARRHAEQARGAGDALLAPVPDPVVPLAAYRLEDVVTDVALELLTALQPSEREVLVLRTACGLSIAQVAELTKLDQLDVRRIARNALARASILASDPVVRRRIDQRAPAVEAAEQTWAGVGPMPSDTTLEDLLAGRPARPGASVRTGLMAAIVAALTSSATVAELHGSGAAYATYRREVASARRRVPVSARLGSRVAVAAGVASIALSGTLIAAYSGVLPDQLQQVAHDWLNAPANGGGGRPDAPSGTGDPTGQPTGDTPARVVSLTHSHTAPGGLVSAVPDDVVTTPAVGAPGTSEAVPPGSTHTPPGSTRTAPAPGSSNTPPGSTRTPPASTKTPPGSTQTPPTGRKTPPGSTKTPPRTTKTPPGSTKTPPAPTPPTTSETPPSSSRTSPAPPTRTPPAHP